MDNITNIAYYNTGNTFTNSAGEDYYDIISPGVAILSADNSTYILYYDGDKVTKIDKKEEGFYDWSKEVAEFLIKKNKYETSKEFLSGLLMCADNEDEDGLYDFIQENGGEVVFDFPSSSIIVCGLRCEIFHITLQALQHAKQFLRLRTCPNSQSVD